MIAKPTTIVMWLIFGAVLVAAALLPSVLGPYQLGLIIGILGYVILSTAWSIFSGPTGYLSLASVAFFGLGAYSVAVLNEVLPYPVVLLCALLVGLALALVVGLASLRLAGPYFIIFTFGLTELVRQLVTFYEVNVTNTLGRYIFLPIMPEQIYLQLLALSVLTFVVAIWIRRSKLGLAVRAIGDDEVAASHAGINVTRAKLTLFAVSASLMTLVGAIQSPRWTYIEPSIAFNPTISFLTIIMALFGGARHLFGPALGAVSIFLLFEWLSSTFPHHYYILLGLLLISIVFLLPNGILSFLEKYRMILTQRILRFERPL